MNRFQDMSSNRFRTNPRYQSSTQSRFRSNSNSRFKQDTSRQPSSGRFKSFTSDTKNPLNLPTNNRWKQDEPAESSKPDKFAQRRNPITKSFSHLRNKIPAEPLLLDSKFINLNAMPIDFDKITTKPKQNKKEKKKKQQQKRDDDENDAKQGHYTNETTTRKKYSKKYDLTEDQKDDLNSSIISQYNYEVIEETDSESELN